MLYGHSGAVGSWLPFSPVTSNDMHVPRGSGVKVVFLHKCTTEYKVCVRLQADRHTSGHAEPRSLPTSGCD